jgi:hypothetical protein
MHPGVIYGLANVTAFHHVLVVVTGEVSALGQIYNARRS